MTRDPVLGTNRSQRYKAIPDDIIIPNKHNAVDSGTYKIKSPSGAFSTGGKQSTAGLSNFGHSVVDVVQKAIDESRIQITSTSADGGSFGNFATLAALNIGVPAPVEGDSATVTDSTGIPGGTPGVAAIVSYNTGAWSVSQLLSNSGEFRGSVVNNAALLALTLPIEGDSAHVQDSLSVADGGGGVGVAGVPADVYYNGAAWVTSQLFNNASQSFVWYDTGIKTWKIKATSDPSSWITETAIGTYTIVVPAGQAVQATSWVSTTAAGATQNVGGGAVNLVLDDSANADGRNQTLADASPVSVIGINIAGETYPLGTLNANAHTVATTFAASVMTINITGFQGQFADGSKITVLNLDGE